MTFEEILAYVAAQLTEPVRQDAMDDGAVVFSSGDPAEVIVRLTSTTVTVASYAVAWQTDGTPAVEPVGVGAVEWQALTAESAMRAVKALITGAREARLATYRTCRFCGQHHPPERMFDDEVCQACGEQEGEVVH